MFDAAKLLDQLLGAGTAQRMDAMSGGKFSQISQQAAAVLHEQTKAVAGKGGYLDQMKHAVPGAANMPDPSQVIADTGDYVAKNSDAVIKGAIAGTVLAGLLGTRTGRAIGGAALRLGGLAAIGALAYNAVQNWRAGAEPGAPSPAPDAGAAGPSVGAGAAPGLDDNARAKAILEAMIAAAKADGDIDPSERARVLAQAHVLGVEAAARAFIETEMAKPLDIAAIGAGIDGVERLSEIYAASALAIDVSRAANAAYLDALAERFHLDPALRAHLDAEVGKLKQS